MRKILFILILLLVCMGYYKSVQAIEIDINNLDPNLWNQIQQEAKERENTRERIGFYFLGKEILEFRPAVEYSEKQEQPEPRSVLMKDRSGKNFWISKQPVIDSNDIYGVLIEKYTYKGIEEYEIILHFKQESWNKIHTVTSQFIQKPFAIVRGDTLFVVPVVVEALMAQTRIGSRIDLNGIEIFKKGLILKDQTSLDAWHSKAKKWLETYIKKHPEDTKMMGLLIRKYFNSNPRECDKAVKLIEKNVIRDNSQAMYYVYASHDCYKTLKRYDSAIKLYEQIVLLNIEKENEISVRNFMAEFYILKGEKQKAIGELEKSLKITKDMSLPSFDYLPEGPNKEQFLKEIKKMKENAIKVQEELIEKVKAESFLPAQ